MLPIYYLLMRKTNKMKIILLFMLMTLTMSTSNITRPVQEPTQSSVVDPDFFKRELQESVLEFVNDLGLDPDTVYIPFRDEL